MFSTPTICPICLRNVQGGSPADQPQVFYLKCPGCSQYSITAFAVDALKSQPLTVIQRANACGWIRESPSPDLDEPELVALRNLQTPIPLEKAIKLFDLLCVVFREPGEWYELDSSLPRFVATAWAQSAKEVQYLVTEVLIGQLAVLEAKDRVDDASEMTVRITPRGWDVNEQRRNPPAPKQPLGFR